MFEPSCQQDVIVFRSWTIFWSELTLLKHLQGPNSGTGASRKRPQQARAFPYFFSRGRALRHPQASIRTLDRACVALVHEGADLGLTRSPPFNLTHDSRRGARIWHRLQGRTSFHPENATSNFRFSFDPVRARYFWKGPNESPDRPNTEQSSGCGQPAPSALTSPLCCFWNSPVQLAPNFPLFGRRVFLLVLS